MGSGLEHSCVVVARRILFWTVLVLSVCAHFWDLDCLVENPECCSQVEQCRDDCSLTARLALPAVLPSAPVLPEPAVTQAAAPEPLVLQCPAAPAPTQSAARAPPSA